jgi:hypothetical protein
MAQASYWQGIVFVHNVIVSGIPISIEDSAVLERTMTVSP